MQQRLNLPSLNMKKIDASGKMLWIIVSLILVGLAVRVWAATYNQFPTVDGVFYLDQTAKLVKHGYVPYSCFPPGWPTLAAIPYAFKDHADPMALLRAGQIANVILGTLMPLLAFFVMRPLLGVRLAVVGMAVLMFLPQNIVYSKNDLSEMSFTCALLGAWLLVRNKKTMVAGIMFCAAYLIRPEALFMAAGVGVWLWFRNRRFPWALSIALIGSMLPYLLFIRLKTGAFSLTSKGIAFSQSHEAYPGWDILSLFSSNISILLPKLGGLLGIPLLVLALWGAVRVRGAYLWLLAPFIPVPFVIYPMSLRFWIPYLPVIILAAGVGALHLSGQSWMQVRWRKAALAVVIAAGLGWAAYDDSYWVRRNDEAYYGLKDAGAWLADKTERSTIVAAYKPYTSFWAGCRFIKYPANLDALGLALWARNNGARYMVVNVQVAHHLVRELDPYLENPLKAELAQIVTLVELIEYDLVSHTTAIYCINDPLDP